MFKIGSLPAPIFNIANKKIDEANKEKLEPNSELLHTKSKE